MKPPIGLAKEYSVYLRKRYTRIQQGVDLTHGWETNPIHASGTVPRADASTFVHNAIQKLVRVVADNPVPSEHLEGLANAVDKRNKRVIGIPTSQHAPGAPIAVFRDRNLELIKSLDRTMVDQLRGVLEEAEKNATRIEVLRAQIQERFDVSRSHADLIATDQTLKLNGNITEWRQTSAGITQYEWSTSGDERVRPMHDELDGTIQNWNAPPVTNEAGDMNHPGGDIRCRCVAVAVIP